MSSTLEALGQPSRISKDRVVLFSRVPALVDRGKSLLACHGSSDAQESPIKQDLTQFQIDPIPK